MCQGGTCQFACQPYFGLCQRTSDCCVGSGLSCQLEQFFGVSGKTSVCLPDLPDQPLDSMGLRVPCGPPCSGWECQLAAACLVVNGEDPCAPFGDVCDATWNVCRNPQTSGLTTPSAEPCLPDGPPCVPPPDSSATAVCAPFAAADGGVAHHCVQPCASTADCADPIARCVQTDGGPGYCDWNGCQANQYFGPCDATGTGDGLCLPLDYGAGVQGYCIATTPDGGVAGNRCPSNYAANHQNGGFCNDQVLCSPAGLCSPICNAGTGGLPACPAGQQCFPWLTSSTGLFNTGFCSPACDFIDPDGGGCPRDQSGLQETCIPQILFGLGDAPTGICAAGVAAPIAAGGFCPVGAGLSLDGLIEEGDPCAAGTICYEIASSSSTALVTCVPMCNRVGQSGHGCSTGQLCQPDLFSGLGVNPTYSGLCQ